MHQVTWDSKIVLSLLLQLLSRLSRIRLCATPQMAAYKAPPSLGFSRQEHWSGLPFLSPVHESESEVTQSCPTLSDPMDYSPPGSSVHEILQARVLEWSAIAFSEKKCQTEPFNGEKKVFSLLLRMWLDFSKYVWTKDTVLWKDSIWLQQEPQSSC